MPPSPNVLEALYGVGQQMQAALANDDLERFFALVAERGTLLESLKAYAHPADITPDWEQTAAALGEQYRMITEAMAAHEDRLGVALATQERYRDAHQRYHPPPASGTILNSDLSV